MNFFQQKHKPEKKNNPITLKINIKLRFRNPQQILENSQYWQFTTNKNHQNHGINPRENEEKEKCAPGNSSCD